MSPIPGLAIGQPAADIVLPDLRGRMVRLSALRGRWVLVNFWGVTCPPCRQEIPALQRAYASRRHLSGRGRLPEILGVDGDLDDPASVLLFVRHTGVTYPILIDTSLKVMIGYHVGQLPTSLDIDPQGIVRFIHVGPLSNAEISGALQGDPKS